MHNGKPLICVSSDIRRYDADNRRMIHELHDTYSNAVFNAGGIPMITCGLCAEEMADLCDGLLLTGGIHVFTLNATGWGFLLIVGLVHTGITYCLYFSTLKELPGQKAAILSYIDPLVAVLISVTVLGESMTLPQLVGGALILGFTLWNEIG